MTGLIPVTKEESMAIRKKYGYAHISIVNRQSNHKKYFVEESDCILKFLKRMRAGGYSE